MSCPQVARFGLKGLDTSVTLTEPKAIPGGTLRIPKRTGQTEPTGGREVENLVDLSTGFSYAVGMAGVALLTRDEGVVAVRVLEVDGVLVEVESGEPVDLISVVAVWGLPALEAVA